MPTPEEKTAQDEARASLERMQNFDVQSLPREQELGTKLNFKDVVGPASRLIELYARLAPAALQDFPTSKLNQLMSVANENYNLLNQVLTFSPEQGNPHDERQALIDQITQAYPHAFDVTHPLIAYSLHRSADFQRLDRDARATLQRVRDQGETLKQQLENQLKEAAEIVDKVRQVAA